MNNKLHVGQLAYAVDSAALGDFFGSAGQVVSAKVITDRDSGRSKGFGFVEMADESEAKAAIDMLNGQELMGRSIRVSVANPPEKRERGFGGPRYR